MKMRTLFVAGLATALVSSSFGTYTARLYFVNKTTGVSSPGEVLVNPGDMVGINWSFTGDGADADRWGILQATLILDGKTIMTDADANTWFTQIPSHLVPPTWFPLTIYWQPNFGPMFDHATDPSGASGGPQVAVKSLYALIGVSGQTPAAKNFQSELFNFTVAAGAVADETLDWAYDARNTGTGLSTRILDASSSTVDITDNYLKVVPEPGSLAVIAAGLAGLSALRHRR